MKITVVVPSWNGRALLPALLESLQRQTLPAAEVLVVDDGSRDESVRWLHQRRPALRPIVLDRNRGFANAANVGIGAAQTELVALLNSDAEPEPEWLAALAAAAGAAPESVASWACAVLPLGDGGRLESGGVRLLSSGFGAPHLAGADAADHVLEQEVFGASGGAMLLKRSAFIAAGEFDVRFFGGFEDVDLACRLRLRDRRCLLVPGARVRHRGGASFGRRRGLRQRCEFRNAVCIAVKNFPPPLLRRCRGAVIAAHLRALVYLVLRGHPLAAAGGELDLWRWWGALRRDRSLIQRLAVDASALDRWIEPA